METCPDREKGAMRLSRGAINNRALVQDKVPVRQAMTSRMTNDMICTINPMKDVPDKVEDRRGEDPRASLAAEDTNFFDIMYKARSVI